MAWDALASIYRNKSEDETAQARNQYAPKGATGGAGAAANAPQAAPLTGFYGNGGSGGGPVSSKFVNFGTMYDLNKDKAAGMAKGLYDSAQAKAEGAQGSLGKAQADFANKAQGGTAKGTIGGAHGTRIENKTTAPETNLTPRDVAPKQPARWRRPSNARYDAYDTIIRTADMGAAQAPITLGSGLQGAVAAGEAAAEANKQPGMTNAGASRYGSLFGPTTGALRAPDASGRADYHHSVSELEAKSGAGQGYTGPDSLKGSMGDDAYGALAEDLRKAEQGTQQLGDAAGIATALGYEPGGNVGMSALDAGLTQTAGRPQFKQLGEKYKGLFSRLGTAQSDSLKAVAGQKAASGFNQKQWADLLKDYQSTPHVDPNAPIILGAAQSEGESGANVGIAQNSTGNNTMSDQFGGLFGTLEEDKGVSQIMSSGYSQQEVMDAWDSLSADEKKALSTRSTDIQAGAEGMFSQETWTSLLESIRAKLAAARTKKNGGG